MQYNKTLDIELRKFILKKKINVIYNSHRCSFKRSQSFFHLMSKLFCHYSLFDFFFFFSNLSFSNLFDKQIFFRFQFFSNDVEFD